MSEVNNGGQGGGQEGSRTACRRQMNRQARDGQCSGSRQAQGRGRHGAGEGMRDGGHAQGVQQCAAVCGTGGAQRIVVYLKSPWF